MGGEEGPVTVRLCDEDGMCLFDGAARRGGEEAGGRGACSASSENMSERGMQKECWHSSVREEEAPW